MTSILIIYGSTSGNTELVCHEIAAHIEENFPDFQVSLQRAELSAVSDIAAYDFCILAASTYGHGIVQDHMVIFLKDFKKQDASGRKFAVIGLGDAKYDREYHIESAYILEEAIKAQKGEIICKPLMMTGNPVWKLQAARDWANELIAAFSHETKNN
jgi:flavodoxin I